MDEARLLDEIRQNVVQGRRYASDEGLEDEMTGSPGVRELVLEAMEKGVDPRRILLEGLSKGMDEVGEKYDSGEYYIPDMLAAAETVGIAMDFIAPKLQEDPGATKGKVIMATVEKDHHDIGKNIVAIMLKGAGFIVKDLGVDVPADRILKEAMEEKADLIGLSALLDTTMSFMDKTIKSLEDAGVRSRFKVMIGGAPTTPEFGKKIGADAHCKDGFEAVRTANKLMEDKRAQA